MLGKSGWFNQLFEPLIRDRDEDEEPRKPKIKRPRNRQPPGAKD